MNRNTADRFATVPTPTMPRTKQDFGVHSRLQTMQHGKLTPFYCRLVYPHSNLKIDMTSFVRMDTSIKVPLDSVILDHYYFFVPFRILDKNFEKILGHKEPYDTNNYSFPQIELDFGYGSTGSSGTGTTCYMDHNSLFNYLGYGAHTEADYDGSPQNFPSYIFTQDNGQDITSNNDLRYGTYTARSATIGGQNQFDRLNSYVLAAYYKIWNEYFRDENLDYTIPIDDLLYASNGASVQSLQELNSNSLFNGFKCLPVNRKHDIFSSGLITPVKGGNGDVLIPMGTSAVPVITGGSNHTASGNKLLWTDTAGNAVTTAAGKRNIAAAFDDSGKTFVPASGFTETNPTWVVPGNLYADLQSTGTSVNQLYLSLALYSLYDKRGTFGTRLIEQIRGSFGLSVPDGLLDRAEYLGGSSQSLNNVPVLNTAASQGAMVGNSATLTGLNSFDKGFNEWGLVIGVSCCRIKHRFNQGVANHALKIKDNLDLYWPEFANISKTGIPNYRIFNEPRLNGSTNDENFNYNEPWIDEHTEIDFAAGDFGSFRGRNNDLAYLWTYQDVYAQMPVFSASWLKEPVNNLDRTLTTQLIPNGNTLYDRHQYMIEYKYRTQLTMPIPVRSHVPNITGRI